MNKTRTVDERREARLRHLWQSDNDAAKKGKWERNEESFFFFFDGINKEKVLFPCFFLSYLSLMRREKEQARREARSENARRSREIQLRNANEKMGRQGGEPWRGPLELCEKNKPRLTVFHPLRQEEASKGGGNSALPRGSRVQQLASFFLLPSVFLQVRRAHVPRLSRGHESGSRLLAGRGFCTAFLHFPFFRRFDALFFFSLFFLSPLPADALP